MVVRHSSNTCDDCECFDCLRGQYKRKICLHKGDYVIFDSEKLTDVNYKCDYCTSVQINNQLSLTNIVAVNLKTISAGTLDLQITKSLVEYMKNIISAYKKTNFCVCCNVEEACHLCDNCLQSRSNILLFVYILWKIHRDFKLYLIINLEIMRTHCVYCYVYFLQISTKLNIDLLKINWLKMITLFVSRHVRMIEQKMSNNLLKEMSFCSFHNRLIISDGNCILCMDPTKYADIKRANISTEQNICSSTKLCENLSEVSHKKPLYKVKLITTDVGVLSITKKRLSRPQRASVRYIITISLENYLLILCSTLTPNNSVLPTKSTMTTAELKIAVTNLGYCSSCLRVMARARPPLKPA